MNGISINPNITIEFIEKYPEKSWILSYIFTNPGIKISDILEKYSDKIDWSYISENPSITEEIIEQYTENLDWRFMSMNEGITVEIIEKYPTKPWRWDFLSENPNITMDFVEKYKEKPWDWDALSKHPFKKEIKRYCILEGLNSNIVKKII